MAKKMSKKNETFYANGSFDGFPVKSGLELVRVFRCREAGVVKDYKVYYDFATSRPFQVLKAKPTVNGKPVNWTEEEYNHSDKLYASEEIHNLSREAFYELKGKKIKEDEPKLMFGRRKICMKGIQALNFK